MSDTQKGSFKPRWGEIKEDGEAWTWGCVVREANAVGDDWKNALTADQVRVLGNDIKLLMKRMRDDHVRRINELERELIALVKAAEEVLDEGSYMVSLKTLEQLRAAIAKTKGEPE